MVVGLGSPFWNRCPIRSTDSIVRPGFSGLVTVTELSRRVRPTENEPRAGHERVLLGLLHGCQKVTATIEGHVLIHAILKHMLIVGCDHSDQFMCMDLGLHDITGNLHDTSGISCRDLKNSCCVWIPMSSQHASLAT